MKNFYVVLIIVMLMPGMGVAKSLYTSGDSIPPLPFKLSPKKRLSDSDIAEKKEGLFLTGLPRFEFDPIRGFGIGGNIFLYQNRTKQDPFFYYTPYRYRVNSEFFIFENGRIRYALQMDAPYIFNTRWRMRADAVLWEDPHAQYWGIGRSSLNDLSFSDKSGGVYGARRNFRKVKDYEDNLARAVRMGDGSYITDFHHNQFIQREHLYNLLFERVFMEGRLRLMFGYEALFTAFEDYSYKVAEEAFVVEGRAVDAINNQTLVSKQINDGTWDRFNLSGFNDSFQFTSMLAAALIYDTRDLEPDPSEGVFLEYSHEYSAPWLGSQFNFNKFMLQGQYIHTLLRWGSDKRRVTFAGLGALGHIFGPNINFIEMWDLSSQAEAGGILVLGGERSLRGFREARFLAPTVALINLEMRSHLYDFRMLKQHFSLGLTPFYDLGSVWDNLTDVNLRKWRGAPGVGARAAWNQSTILRLDYGHSREGGQFFFGFSHIF
ncbi:MAG: BamA/TamA family outer membrane protein [Cyclobacteriaceae bacterium]|nr:BamA/TamA family outer membrane protein [Cyclobacteriaceae bacterium]